MTCAVKHSASTHKLIKTPIEMMRERFIGISRNQSPDLASDTSLLAPALSMP
jgi:hypothetical protein